MCCPFESSPSMHRSIFRPLWPVLLSPSVVCRKPYKFPFSAKSWDVGDIPVLHLRLPPYLILVFSASRRAQTSPYELSPPPQAAICTNCVTPLSSDPGGSRDPRLLRFILCQLSALNRVTAHSHGWDKLSVMAPLLPFEGEARGQKGAANGLWSLHTLPTAKQITSNEVSGAQAASGLILAGSASLRLPKKPASSGLIPPLCRPPQRWEVPAVNQAGQCASWHANVGHCICKCVISEPHARTH